jgi:hypothetical protein
MLYYCRSARTNTKTIDNTHFDASRMMDLTMQRSMLDEHIFDIDDRLMFGVSILHVKIQNWDRIGFLKEMALPRQIVIFAK